jgi:hypothetical protein
MHRDRRPKPDRSPEALEARLRALPQPPIPANLEARLLATIPADLPVRRRRWAIGVGVVGALAAACFLAVLAWPDRDGKHAVTNPPPIASVPSATPQPLDNSDTVAAWRNIRRVLDGRELPPFTWPLSETQLLTATSIPPDLLN